MRFFNGSMQEIIKQIKDIYVDCAQDEYDTWHPDELGEDLEVGCGGICDLIADAVASSVCDLGYAAWTLDSGTEDAPHTSVCIDYEGKHYCFDIPYQYYEIYHGPFQYEKIQEVEFNRNMVIYHEAPTLEEEEGSY